ncbi:nicotinamidase/pyrazinamidase [Nitrosomonas sp. Nm51]|nr:nicotinamidase/pyrazinamidase [Nitrosomonas sp. Nm51]
MIIVDLQNDFLPGGSLPVSGGNTIIPTLNRYIADFHAHRLPIVASRDWHPENHCSFEASGGRWPAHCIAKTNGAAFPAALELPAYTKIISKATTQARDAYSAFSETQLNELLRSLNVKRLFVGGLATEYCVLNTVEDAIRFHYVTFILEDAACAINHQPDDGRDALLAMKRLGAIPIDRKMLEP